MAQCLLQILCAVAIRIFDILIHQLIAVNASYMIECISMLFYWLQKSFKF